MDSFPLIELLGPTLRHCACSSCKLRLLLLERPDWPASVAGVKRHDRTYAVRVHRKARFACQGDPAATESTTKAAVVLRRVFLAAKTQRLTKTSSTQPRPSMSHLAVAQLSCSFQSQALPARWPFSFRCLIPREAPHLPCRVGPNNWVNQTAGSSVALIAASSMTAAGYPWR